MRCGRSIRDREVRAGRKICRACDLSEDALRDAAGTAGRAIVSIQEELWWWKKEMEKQGKFVEASGGTAHYV